MHSLHHQKVNFIYLNAFSGMGGIEKFNRAFIESLATNTTQTSFLSFYDRTIPEKFCQSHQFTAFDSKPRGVLQSLLAIYKADLSIIGHLNLAILAVISKIFFPKRKITFIAHGIEIWQGVSLTKKLAVRWADTILAVSEYSKQRLVEVYGISPHKVVVFPNTLSADFVPPVAFNKPNYLLERHGLLPTDKVLLTLARLSSSEQYKGYDSVIRTLPVLVQQFPNIHYIIAGKYDDKEYQRLQALIQTLGVAKYITFTGFVKDEEIIDYYLLADTFVMPSRGEGFGIVFIEAMACGIPALAGNLDGSVDALLKGKVGKLVNPDDTTAIAQGIRELLSEDNSVLVKTNLQKTILDNFSFQRFIARTHSLVLTLR